MTLAVAPRAPGATKALPPASSAPAVAADSYDEKGSLSRLQRYSRFVPGAGDVNMIVYGVKELKAARSQNARNNALTDLGLGIVSAVHRLAELPIYAGALMTVPAAMMAVAGPVTAVTGLITTFVDAGRDFYNARTLGDRRDGIAGGIKLASGSAAAAAAWAGNAPVLLAASLVYCGSVVWQNHESFARAVGLARGRQEG